MIYGGVILERMFQNTLMVIPITSVYKHNKNRFFKAPPVVDKSHQMLIS